LPAEGPLYFVDSIDAAGRVHRYFASLIDDNAIKITGSRALAISI